MIEFIGGVALALAAAGAQAQDGGALVGGLEKLAEAGNADALYHLGMLHQNGLGTPRDLERALGYFRRAAAAGSALGAYKLGCYYAGQYGVIEPDGAEALRYKLVAAEAGYSLAQLDVAAIFARRGETATAAEWLGKAASQGERRALLALSNLHGGGHGAPRDAAASVAYLALLAKLPDMSAEVRTKVAEREGKLTPDERARMRAIVDEYAPGPTPLTLEARSGRRAAEELLARRR